MVYISGCIGMQAATGKLVTGGVEAEAQEVMKNLKAGEPIALVPMYISTEYFLCEFTPFLLCFHGAVIV